MTAARQGLLVMAVAAAAHATYHWAMPALIFPDSVRYVALAADFPLRMTTGNWDLVSVPGYPLFLWLCGRWITTTDGIVAIQHGLAVATCGLLWLLVRRTYGPRAALIAGLVVAISPFRHYYAQSILTESLAEFLLVGGLCVGVRAADARFARLIAMRAAAGMILGGAVLVRANLLPTAVVAGWMPPRRTDATRQRVRYGAAALASTVGWLCVLLPWLGFNARRDVAGLTGSAGYLFNEFANLHGVGRPIALPRESTPQLERDLQRIAWERVRADPVGYAQAVLRTATTFVVHFPIYGDIAPRIPQSYIPPDSPPLSWLSSLPPPAGWQWRRAVHRLTSSVYKLLLSLGWLGLAAGGIASVGRGRMDLAVLAAAPIAGVLALSLMVVNSARYAFPFEAVALGVGLPAGWSAIEHMRRRLRCG